MSNPQKFQIQSTRIGKNIVRLVAGVAQQMRSIDQLVHERIEALKVHQKTGVRDLVNDVVECGRQIPWHRQETSQSIVC